MQKVSTKEKLLPILSNKNVGFKKEIVAGVTTFLTISSMALTYSIGDGLKLVYYHMLL